MFKDLFVELIKILIKFLLLNSLLLKITFPVLAFNCSHASSVINKIRNPLTICGFHLHLRIPLTFCGIHLQLRNPEQLAIIACCGNRDTTNVTRKFTLQLFVRGIFGKFVTGIHLQFKTCFKISFWNPGTYKHKIGHLSNAQFGLVRKILAQTHMKFLEI